MKNIDSHMLQPLSERNFIPAHSDWNIRPWFLAAYFSISPLVDVNLPLSRFLSSHLAKPTDILVIPVSAMVSYINPVVLMSLRSPSVISEQLAIALWNVFPLTMTIFQTASHSMVSFIGRVKGRQRQTRGLTESSRFSLGRSNLLRIFVGLQLYVPYWCRCCLWTRGIFPHDLRAKLCVRVPARKVIDPSLFLDSGVEFW